MEYHVNRKVWQVLWDAILGHLGFGSNNGTQFNNDIFECKSYCWFDDGDDIERNEYHFHHKPSGFKIQWYKYALRGAYCNINISDEQFVDILYDCFNSLQPISGNVKIIYDIDKWWAEENVEE